MSQHRDDRDAARLRIEALEAQLAEREAEIAARQASLSGREAEIGRLREELDFLGPAARGVRPSPAPWRARLTGLAVGFTVVAGAVWVLVMHRPGTAIAEVAPPPPDPLVIETPLLADPMAPVGQHEVPAEGTAAPVQVATERPDGRVWGETTRAVVSGPPNEERMRRILEPKVLGGTATSTEIKMLKAICSHLGDRPCRDRAHEALMRARDESR